MKTIQKSTLKDRELRVVLLIQATRGFDRGVLSGISRYASIHGPWSFYREHHAYYVPRRKTKTDELRAWNPTGAVCPIHRLDLVEPLKIPVVGIDLNEYAGPIPGVVTDDINLGRQAAEHLLSLGLYRFAFCGLGSMRWSNLRQEGFQSVIAKHGYPMEVYRSSKRGRLTWVREEPAVRQWLKSLPKPIGLFCPNDDRSAFVLETCRTLAYGVPEDIAVIGVDDDPYVCELTNPSLSSVATAAERAGYDLAELLHRMMVGKEDSCGQRIVAPAAGVTARQSTDTLMVQDEEVRRALQFIRENVSDPIQVRDVVRATFLSHRALNERFQRQFGTSISTHVSVARAAYVSRFLRETDLPIHRIAELAGFPSSQHFARFFRRCVGVTPKEYRNQHAPP